MSVDSGSKCSVSHEDMPSKENLKIPNALFSKPETARESDVGITKIFGKRVSA